MRNFVSTCSLITFVDFNGVYLLQISLKITVLSKNDKLQKWYNNCGSVQQMKKAIKKTNRLIAIVLVSHFSNNQRMPLKIAKEIEGEY